MPVETIELVVHPLFRYIAEYRTPESRGAVFRLPSNYPEWNFQKKFT